MEDRYKRYGGEREGLGGFLLGFQIFRGKDREGPIFEGVLSQNEKKHLCRHVPVRRQSTGSSVSITESSRDSEGTHWGDLGPTLGLKLIPQV